MTESALGAALLTDEQAAAVAQPVDAAMLITAGAGTGKTHTLVTRLERLLTDGAIRGHEVLVLTFSRSAVRELRRRLRCLAESGEVVRVQTFDSWALDVLLDVDASRDSSTMSFDGRIQAATAAIQDGLTDERHDDLRHVVVDEVQDLVGDRRRLVQALLDRFDCGFTVVGDPAQSIYGFQVADPAERATETGAFFAWLRDTFADQLVELTLSENFRARTAEARSALPFGPRLRSGDASDHYESLRDVLLGALAFGGIDDDFALHGLRAGDGRTAAVLCRTNGQALVVSQRLHEAGVRHRLQREARDRVVPSWMAALFRGTESSTLNRERFGEVLRAMPDEVDADAAWTSLLRCAASSGRRTVDLARLRDRLATGRLPDELTAQPAADLVVSSFHRAKGLEFDRVAVVDPDLVTRDDADVAEEARLLYAAMTRPRTDLLRIDPLRRWDVRQDKRTDRWAVFGRRQWMRLGIEVGAQDVHTDEPAGTVGVEADPIDVQRRLMASVRPGDPIALERLHQQSVDDRLSPEYLVLHDGDPIGVASDRFRTALVRLLGRPSRFPYRVTGLRVDAVETVAGDEVSGRLAGLGSHGVWMSPRLVGLGRFVWNEREKHDE